MVKPAADMSVSNLEKHLSPTLLDNTKGKPVGKLLGQVVSNLKDMLTTKLHRIQTKISTGEWINNKSVSNELMKDIVGFQRDCKVMIANKVNSGDKEGLDVSVEFVKNGIHEMRAICNILAKSGAAPEAKAFGEKLTQVENELFKEVNKPHPKITEMIGKAQEKETEQVEGAAEEEWATEEIEFEQRQPAEEAHRRDKDVERKKDRKKEEFDAKFPRQVLGATKDDFKVGKTAKERVDRPFKETGDRTEIKDKKLLAEENKKKEARLAAYEQEQKEGSLGNMKVGKLQQETTQVPRRERVLRELGSDVKKLIVNAYKFNNGALTGSLGAVKRGFSPENKELAKIRDSDFSDLSPEEALKKSNRALELINKGLVQLKATPKSANLADSFSNVRHMMEQAEALETE